MWLQLFLFFTTFIIYLFLQASGDTPRNRRTYTSILIVLLVLQSALRGLSVGEDTFSYYEEWLEAGNTSWSTIWQSFYNVYILGIGKDAGYGLVLKLLHYVCPSFRIFLFIYTIALFIPLCKLAEKYLTSLRQLYMFFCLYQVMFYSFFSVTGIRQGMATIATLYAIRLIERRKLVKFLLLIFLASFIHRSVLLFIPFYFIANIRNSNKLLLVCMIGLPAIFVIARPLVSFMVDFSGSEQYRRYAESTMETGGAVNFLLLILTIAICTFVTKKKVPDAIPDFIVNAVAVAVFFTPLMWIDTSLMRVIQYFSLFSLIAMPLALENIIPSKRNILYVAFWAVLLYTTIRHNYSYSFFWDNVALL